MQKWCCMKKKTVKSDAVAQEPFFFFFERFFLAFPSERRKPSAKVETLGSSRQGEDRKKKDYEISSQVQTKKLRKKDGKTQKWLKRRGRIRFFARSWSRNDPKIPTSIQHKKRHHFAAQEPAQKPYQIHQKIKHQNSSRGTVPQNPNRAHQNPRPKPQENMEQLHSRFKGLPRQAFGGMVERKMDAFSSMAPSLCLFLLLPLPSSSLPNKLSTTLWDGCKRLAVYYSFQQLFMRTPDPSSVEWSTVGDHTLPARSPRHPADVRFENFAGCHVPKCAVNWIMSAPQIHSLLIQKKFVCGAPDGKEEVRLIKI